MIENEIRRAKREDMTDALLASQVTTEVIHGNRVPQQVNEMECIGIVRTVIR